MLPVTILHEAELELWDAAKYYESKSSGLGSDFINEMQDGVKSIREAPFRQPEREDFTRRFLTKRFPYEIVYTVHDNRVWLVAFSNQRHWRNAKRHVLHGIS
jgi:hypothetical protein